MTAKCYDCLRPYGEGGFEDLLIPDRDWLEISPTGNEGGLLCACCISARLTKGGIRCVGAFMSGPITSVSRHLMNALLRVEHIEKRLDRAAITEGQAITAEAQLL